METDRETLFSNDERSQPAFFRAVAQGAARRSLILFSPELTFHQQTAPLGWLMQFDAICRFSSQLCV